MGEFVKRGLRLVIMKRRKFQEVVRMILSQKMIVKQPSQEKNLKYRQRQRLIGIFVSGFWKPGESMVHGENMKQVALYIYRS